MQCRKAATRFAVATVIALGGAPSAHAEVEYVIHISVDGLASNLLQNLIDQDEVGDYASFKRFIDDGATTFNARTDFTHTNTLPNHTSMLTSRPVLQPPGKPNTVHHGYVSNSTPAPNHTLHKKGNPNLSYVASVFDVFHDHGLSTGLFASKSKFVIYEQSYNLTNGAPDTVATDYQKDKIDHYMNMSSGSPANASLMHGAFISALSAKPIDYTFVHYRDPDSAGHRSGWGSAAWNQAVRNVDGYLGDVFALVESSIEMAGRTVIILTSDHGGTGFGHSNPANANTYIIPFFVWGAGVTPGSDLYSLNHLSRADPKVGRPNCCVVTPPIRNGDSGNLALGLLGFGTVPGSTINALQDLRVGPTMTAFGNEPTKSGAQLFVARQANGTVAIHFTLQEDAFIDLAVYDVRGRLTRHLQRGEFFQGSHRALWNSSDSRGQRVPSGVFFVRLNQANTPLTTKTVHIR